MDTETLLKRLDNLEKNLEKKLEQNSSILPPTPSFLGFPNKQLRIVLYLVPKSLPNPNIFKIVL